MRTYDIENVRTFTERVECYQGRQEKNQKEQVLQEGRKKPKTETAARWSPQQKQKEPA